MTYMCNEKTYFTVKAILAYLSSKTGKHICYSKYAGAFYLIHEKSYLKSVILPPIIDILKKQV